jgi:hypothetical protein
MMIITPTAKRTSFFHADKAYPASLETDSQIFDLSQHSKDTGRRDECHGGLLFPPERGEP